MRKIANLRTERHRVRRCMLFSSASEVLLFTYSSLEDWSCDADTWFESVEDAEAYCREELGVRDEDWTTLGDAPPGCQDDWIAPVRVPGSDAGEPQWGRLERLGEDGVWRAVAPNAVEDAD